MIIGATIVFFYAGLGNEGNYVHAGCSYMVMAFAYTLPALFISFALTGHVLPQVGLVSETVAGIPFLDKLDAINRELGFAAYTSGKLSKLNMFCITAALMCGTAGLPHVIVRYFTVKNVRAVRVSAAWTLVFIAVIYLTAPAIGAFARVNLIKAVNEVPRVELPGWFEAFEQTGATFMDGYEWRWMRAISRTGASRGE